MRHALVGAARLTRLGLRRDRVRLAVWVGAIVLLTVAVAGSFAELYPGEEGRQQAAATMGSPAALAMTGPARFLDDYHYGAMMTHQMLAFTAATVAIMSILTVIRHTRAEEESGRAEVVRASVVGRHAHLASALLVALAANLAVAAFLAVALPPLGVEGITWEGSALYGLAHLAVGMVFAAVAGIAAQVSEHSRGASGLAFAVLGLAYVLRAVGDAAGNWLSWASPIGWSQLTYVYVENRWWVLLPAVALTAVCVMAGASLSVRRDVGAGLRHPRPGPANASPALRRPLGFALRLHRGLILGFVAGLGLIGVAYGSIVTEVEEMLGGMDLIGDALAEMGGATMVDSFASLVTMVMAILASVYTVMAALRPRTEEASGRAEPVLATGLSAARWLGSHLIVAAVASVVVLAAAGLGFGLTALAMTGDDSYVIDFLAAAVAYAPALWLTIGVAALLFGLSPRWGVLAWLLPVYGFIVGYLGTLLQFPDWMVNLSPFGHIPGLPVDPMEWLPIVLLTLAGVGLTIVGMALFRRRDLASTV